MEKAYFYVPDREYATDELGQPSIIHKIKTEDIDYLAHYIIDNVEPLSAITVAEGYISAFTYYSESNKEYPYYEIFEQLKYGDNSRLLYTVVTLVLLEKGFRKDGINQKSMESYNRLQKEYEKYLDYNQQAYGKLYEKRKMK